MAEPAPTESADIVTIPSCMRESLESRSEEFAAAQVQPVEGQKQLFASVFSLETRLNALEARTDASHRSYHLEPGAVHARDAQASLSLALKDRSTIQLIGRPTRATPPVRGWLKFAIVSSFVVNVP